MTQTLAPESALHPAARDPFPLYPPRAWFDEAPDWFNVGEKLTIVTTGPDAGRVAATIASHDQCILDGQPGCWTAPYSPTEYGAAHQGDTLTAEGDVIKTANLGGGVNHARLAATFREAVDHHSNTASQLMRIRYHDTDSHIVALGALWPDVTDLDLAVARASALSGDWRFRPELGQVDMTGAILVNTPGFPLMARAASLAGEVYMGGLGGVGGVDEEPACSCHTATASDAERIHDLEVTVAALAELVGPNAVRAALNR